MIKGVLFDLDGTLLNRDASLYSFLLDQYDRLDVLKSIDQSVYVSRFIKLDMRGYVWKDKVYEQLIKEYDLNAEWESLLEDYAEGFQEHCIGFDNLHETLVLLKEMGLQLGMITNGFGRFQVNNIKALGIEAYFDTILVSETEGLRKPDSAIFTRALDRMGLAPEAAIFVGDHPTNDVIASRNAGMRGIWKEDKHYEEDFEHDGKLGDLLELIPMVRRLNE